MILALSLFGVMAASLPAARAQAPDAGASADSGQATSATAQPGGVRFGDLRDQAAPVPWWQRVTSFGGLLGMVVIAWAMSTHRRRVPWRVIGWGIALQLVFGIFVMKTSVGRALFTFLNEAVKGLLGFTAAGSGFIFQQFGENDASKWLATFAFGVLPTIIFFSSLMAVLYHLGVMQRAVSGIAWIMRRTMGTSGAETLSTAANIFVGQTEAPLVIRPYVGTMTLSELNAVMVAGFATVAGGVLAAYVGMLEGYFPDIAGHLIAASVMSAPAALIVAKVMLPETEHSPTSGGAKISVEKIDVNVIDAAARGAGEGMKLALNVAAMLLAFLALVALLNWCLAAPVTWYNDWTGAGVTPLTLERLLGWLFWPIALLMGVPPEDCATVGTLLGEKMVLNEFVAYKHMADMLSAGTPMGYRSVVIASYALCGFANFGSIAIQIGGIGGIAPERRGDLAKLGMRAMIGGTLAACMTATVAGMFV